MKKRNFPATWNIMTSLEDKLVYAMGDGIGTRVFLRETREKVDQIKGPKNNAAKVSSDGEYVAFYETQNKLHLYKIGLPHTLCFVGKKGKGTDAPFTFADGGRVVLAADLNTVYAYEVPSGRQRTFLELPPEYRCKGIATLGQKIMISTSVGISGMQAKLFLYETLNDLAPRVYAYPDWGSTLGEFLDENHFAIFKGGATIRQEFLEGMDEKNWQDVTSSEVKQTVWCYAIDGPKDLSVPEKKFETNQLVYFDFAFSPDKKFCAIKSGNRLAVLYRTDTWERLDHVVQDHISHVEMSPSGKYWLVAGRPESKILALPR